MLAPLVDAQVTAFNTRAEWTAAAAPSGTTVCENVEADAPGNNTTPFTTAGGWVFASQGGPLTVSVIASGSVNGSNQVHFRDFTAGVRISQPCQPTGAVGFDYRTSIETWTVIVGGQSFVLPANTTGFFGFTSVAPVADFVVTGAAGPQGGLALDNLCCASTGGSSVIGTALGTATPPTVLGGLPMQQFALDNGDGVYRPGVGADATVIPGVQGSIVLGSPFNHRRVGTSWPSWINGFDGDVYFSNGATTVQINLPNGTQGFIFYVAPETAGAFNITATANGTTQVVQDASGPVGFAFHTTSGNSLNTITLQASRPFAIGQLLAAAPPPELHVDTGRNINCSCCFDFAIGQYLGVTGDIQTVVATVPPGVTITSASWSNCPGGPPVLATGSAASFSFPAGLTASGLNLAGQSTYTYTPTCTVRICFSSTLAGPVPVTFNAFGPGVPRNPLAMTRTTTVAHPSCEGGSTSPAFAVGCDVTYTTSNDFDNGTLLSVNHNAPNGNQLQVSRPATPLPFIVVACSARGTVVRIDVNTGTVIGEYRTAPFGLPSNPSRTTVDLYGNAWIGNRDQQCDGPESQGSVVKIGLCIGGCRGDRTGTPGNYTFTPNPNGQYIKDPVYSTAMDRDGDGLIRTSRGLADILAWNNTPGSDPVGGGVGPCPPGLVAGGSALVADADDEVILVFQRTSAGSIRHVSVDASNDVWVGGYDTASLAQGPNRFNKLRGTDGAILATVTSGGAGFPATGLGGYGGLTNCSGVLWSSSPLEDAQTAALESGTWRYNTSTTGQIHVPIPYSYGLAIDTNGFIWNTSYVTNTIYKVAPSGLTWTGPFGTGGSQPTGVGSTPADNNVWVANRLGTSVGRLLNTGALVAPVPVGVSPTGVAADTNGKVWVTNLGSHSTQRIAPNCPSQNTIINPNGGAGCVDLTVPLGPGAGPYNYSDMTGLVALNATSGQGSWSVVQDSQQLGQRWGTVCWNTEAQGSTPPGTSIIVEVRTADTIAGLTGTVSNPNLFTPIANNIPFAKVGRFIEVRVTLKGSLSGENCNNFVSPILSDLCIKCCAAINPVSVLCETLEVMPLTLTGNFTYTFTFTNLTGQPIQYLFTPQSSGVTFNGSPAPGHSLALAAPVPPGGISPPISVTIAGANAGERFCFDMTFANPNIEVCCKVDHCVDLPDCDCVQFPQFRAVCVPNSGNYTLTFNAQNLFSGPIDEMHIFPLPIGSGVTATAADFYFAAVPPGGTTPLLTTTISGAGPGRLCFRISIHREGIICCSEVRCINLPACGTVITCPPDIGNQGGIPGSDGVLDNNDFVVFIDRFFTGDTGADVGSQGGGPGADGHFDNNDFIVFIDQFFAGC